MHIKLSSLTESLEQPTILVLHKCHIVKVKNLKQLTNLINQEIVVCIYLSWWYGLANGQLEKDILKSLNIDEKEAL